MLFARGNYSYCHWNEGSKDVCHYSWWDQRWKNRTDETVREVCFCGGYSEVEVPSLYRDNKFWWYTPIGSAIDSQMVEKLIGWNLWHRLTKGQQSWVWQLGVCKPIFESSCLKWYMRIIMHELNLVLCHIQYAEWFLTGQKAAKCLLFFFQDFACEPP